MNEELHEEIRVALVDDHPLFREGVSHTLNADPSINVVGEGKTADDAIRLATDLLPDIILLDISMPGGGVNAAKAIAAACPVITIAMLTVSEHDDDILGALHGGAKGYILKGIGGAELIKIIKDLHQGNPYVSPDLFARLLSEVKEGGDNRQVTSDVLSSLTAREEQILERIAEVGEFDAQPGAGIAIQLDVEDAVGVLRQAEVLVEVVEDQL